jgi:hypothetical protein
MSSCHPGARADAPPRRSVDGPFGDIARHREESPPVYVHVDLTPDALRRAVVSDEDEDASDVRP